jgi:hypothetical protein
VFAVSFATEDHAMAVSGLATAANIQSASQQLSPTSNHHRHHGGVQAPSISDVDAQSSSVAPTSGRPGSKVDFTV